MLIKEKNFFGFQHNNLKKEMFQKLKKKNWISAYRVTENFMQHKEKWNQKNLNILILSHVSQKQFCQFHHFMQY